MPRVLVVDDEDVVRAFCRDALQRAGYEVETASGAREGIEKYRASPCDVVLMDVLMPGGDGAEATEMLMREYPEAKVIAMSGGILRHPRFFLEHAESLGAKASLAKPFTAEQLAAAVAQVLGSGSVDR